MGSDFNYDDYMQILSPGFFVTRKLEKFVQNKVVDFFSKNEQHSEYIGDEFATSDDTDSRKLLYKLMSEADSCAIDGRFDEALAFYSRAEQIDPNFETIYLDRAKVKEKSGDIKGAIEDYTRSIEMNNQSPQGKKFNRTTYIERAKLKIKEKDFEGAISDYQRALELKPDDITTRRELAKLKIDTKDYKGALSEYSRIIEEKPNDAKSYSDRATIHQLMRNYNLALEDARKAVSLDPNKVLTHNTLGEILQETGNFDESIEVYTKAIENADKQLDPNNEQYSESLTGKILEAKIDAITGRAFSKQLNNDIQGAIEDFSEAISISEDEERLSKLYSFRADAYTAIGDYDSAIADLESAKKETVQLDREIKPVQPRYAANINSENQDSLAASPDYYNDDIQRKIDTLKRMKEFDFTKIPDGKIEEVHQGGIGDCYFLSDLAANPDLLELSDCLKWNEDGSASVKLHSVIYNKKTQEYEVAKEPQVFPVSKEELEQHAFKLHRDDGTSVGVTINSMQDIDLKAMEIAYFKAADYSFETINGGTLGNTASLLFGSTKLPDGRRVLTDNFDGYSKEDAIKLINKSYSAALRRNTDKLQGYDILGGHAYMVNGYNAQTGTVSISNPHNENRLSDNDDIVIPFEEFIKYFSVEYLARVEL